MRVRVRHSLALLAAIALLPSCSLKKYAIAKVGDALSASGPSVYETDDDIELAGEALPFSLKFVESLLVEAPNHRGLLLTACRGYTLYSYAYVDFEAEKTIEEDLAQGRKGARCANAPPDATCALSTTAFAQSRRAARDSTTRLVTVSGSIGLLFPPQPAGDSLRFLRGPLHRRSLRSRVRAGGDPGVLRRGVGGVGAAGGAARGGRRLIEPRRSRRCGAPSGRCCCPSSFWAASSAATPRWSAAS